MKFEHYYKQLEEKLNRKIKQLFNCHQFIVIVKMMLSLHLRRVRNQRILVNNWLDSKDYANKEEIANVAKNYISNEAKVDELDDLLFSMTKKWNKQKKSLITINEVLNELKTLIEQECTKEENNIHQKN
ncbi:hypothetical protein ACIFOT_15660 [Neobacillus sp. NRS-1170]|uniref:hypothetical protein n=1 Tax=Neobacillus sp. NRS-1170 TaxID=3233898 RepID=UPI003D29F0F0